MTADISPSPALEEIRAELERLRAIGLEATAGPWEVHRSASFGVRLASDESDWPLAENFRRGADAEFAAVARTAMPRLVAAVKGVLELHRPDGRNTQYLPCEQHAIWRTDGLPAGVQASCPDCRVVETVICWQKGCKDYGWPCPTYLATTRALTGKEPDHA